MDAESPARYLSTDQASEYLSVSKRTMEGWRVRRVGPPYSRLVGLVRYDIIELDAFMERWVEPQRALGG